MIIVNHKTLMWFKTTNRRRFKMVNTNVTIEQYVQSHPYISDICEQEGLDPTFISLQELYDCQHANFLRNMVERMQLDIPTIHEQVSELYKSFISTPLTINPKNTDKQIGVFPWGQRTAERMKSKNLLEQISTLVKEFDPTKVGAVIVSQITMTNSQGEPEVYFHIEDGLGRIIAAFILGVDIPIIISQKSIDTIQDDFYDINNNSQTPGPYELVKKHLKDGNPLYVFANEWLKSENINWTEHSPNRCKFHLLSGNIKRFLRMVGDFGGINPVDTTLPLNLDGTLHKSTPYLEWEEILKNKGPWMSKGLELYHKLFYETDPNPPTKFNLDLSIWGGCVNYAAFFGSRPNVDQNWPEIMDWMVEAFNHNKGSTFFNAITSLEVGKYKVHDSTLLSIQDKNLDRLGTLRGIGTELHPGVPKRGADVVNQLLIHLQNKYQVKMKKRTTKDADKRHAVIPTDVHQSVMDAFAALQNTSIKADKSQQRHRTMIKKAWLV